MKKAKRGGEFIWATHDPRTFRTDGGTLIRVAEDGLLLMSILVGENNYYGPIVLTRMHARLLARRLNQALEETK